MALEVDGTPQEKRRGWLKNGNPPCDFSKAPRCGAKTRRGSRCRCPAMSNGRCCIHGGLSTGPTTPEGIERIRRAATKHGRYSKEALAERRQVQRLLKECRGVLAGLCDIVRDDPPRVLLQGLGSRARIRWVDLVTRPIRTPCGSAASARPRRPSPSIAPVPCGAHA